MGNPIHYLKQIFSMFKHLAHICYTASCITPLSNKKRKPKREINSYILTILKVEFVFSEEILIK